MKMINVKPSLSLIKILAGEGDFYLYKALVGKKIFVFLKLLSNSLMYSFGKDLKTTQSSLVFIKGENQYRLFKYAKSNFSKQIDARNVFCKNVTINNKEDVVFPRVKIVYFLNQVFFLFLMLITGKRHYLNLYLLSFYCGISDVVSRSFPQVNKFLCFNDQSYDVASIVESFNQRGCQTFVYQHGLILSKQFYFPVVSKIFLAWGDSSRQEFKSWRNNSELLVTGRYLNDIENKSEILRHSICDRKIKVLVAPSFNFDEIKKIVFSISSFNSFSERCSFSIKFHPATKFKTLIKLWCKYHTPFLVEEYGHMENLSNEYDFLITKNSTSTVDFLLRGKLVFCFEPLSSGEDFPSIDYVFDINQFAQVLGGENIDNLGHKNKSRLSFIQKNINVC